MKPVSMLRVPVGAALLGCAALLLPGQALADPGDISGTWHGRANDTPGDLQISQAPDGTLRGTIFGDPIEGFYVPSVRRFVFLRKLSNGDPIQFYEGWVSWNGSALGGEFHAWNSAGGAGASGCSWNFSASR
jgi:hypothetical protein